MKCYYIYGLQGVFQRKKSLLHLSIIEIEKNKACVRSFLESIYVVHHYLETKIISCTLIKPLLLYKHGYNRSTDFLQSLNLEIEENQLIYCYLTCINIVSFTFLIHIAETKFFCASFATG